MAHPDTLPAARLKRRLSWFRICFGVYLTVNFSILYPAATELFSRQGILPHAGLNPKLIYFPSLLNLIDTPLGVRAWLLACIALSLLFAFDIAARWIAIALWYGWTCLINRNYALTVGPHAYLLGWMLLFWAALPRAALRDPGSPASPSLTPYFTTAWGVIGVMYTFSGVAKLFSPSWVDGSSLIDLLTAFPMVRLGAVRDALLSGPPDLLRLLTWSALFAELLFLPASLFKNGRRAVWIVTTLMHAMNLIILRFEIVSSGMLVSHFLLAVPGLRWEYLSRREKPIEKG